MFLELKRIHVHSVRILNREHREQKNAECISSQKVSLLAIVKLLVLAKPLPIKG